MQEHNGHRSWNAWNVALWLGNDENLYSIAKSFLHQTCQNTGKAAHLFMQEYKGLKTPDGATYNHLSVKLALERLIE